MCDFDTLKVIKVPARKPLYGYKELKWEPGTKELTSPAFDTNWRRGGNWADGTLSMEEQSGFHAYRTAAFKRGWKIYHLCVRVALWGQVAVCEDSDGGGRGYRAEYAKIVRIVGYGPYATKEDCAAAGKRYKVPVGYREYEYK